MIKINISYPLITGILKTEFNEEILQKEKERLEEYLSKNDVLNQIIERTGMSYSKDIEIWLINGSYESSPNPNLLKIGDNMIFDFYCLITHNIFLENDFYDNFFIEFGISESILEATVYFVASQFVKIDKSDKFQKYIWDEVDKLNFDDSPIINQVNKIKNLIKS